MFSKSKIPEREFKLINDKLDYLIDKVDYTDEILEGLINIALGSPPDSIPEAPISENKSNVPCTYSSDSNPEAPINENESELPYDADTSDVSANSIRFCLYKYIYIWEVNGRNYWAFLLNIDRTSVSGFRWSGRNWVYFGVDLKRIDSFVCYR